MNIRDLEYFYQLSKLKSYTDVAHYFQVSQPTVTYAIKRLEDHYACQLVEKSSSNRVLHLTQPGKVLANHAREVLIEIEKTEKAVERSKKNLLRIGLPPLITSDIMKKFGTHDEELEIFRQSQLVQLGSRDLMRLLVRGDLDFSLLGSLEPISHAHLTSQLLYKKEFFVIVSKDHPLADRKEISFKEVLEETFILLDEHHVHMTAFKRLNARFDDLAQSTVVLTDSNLVLSFIEENLGIGLMTDLTLFLEYPNVVKIPLVEEEKTVFYISYAYPNEGEPQALLSSFIERLEKCEK